jgi:hypothetical protein
MKGSASLALGSPAPDSQEGTIMGEFKRIKIHVSAESAGMLLPEDQIAGACNALRDKLLALDLAVVTVEPEEEPPVDFPESLAKELD